MSEKKQMEIISALMEGDTNSIKYSELDPEKKARLERISEENKEKQEYNNNQEKIKLFKTKNEIEKIKKIEESRINDDDIVKLVNTDFKDLSNKVLEFCSRKPIPILADVAEEFSEYMPLYPGTYTVIGGYTSSGKTTFVSKIVLDAMKSLEHRSSHKKILYISGETPSQSVATMLMSRILGFNVLDAIQNNNLPEEKAKKALDHLQGKISVIDTNVVDISHVENFKKVVQWCLDSGEYGLVIVDYIQCIDHSDNLSDGIGTQAIKEVSHQITHWALKYQQTSFVAFAQLKKSSKDNASFKERTEKNRQDITNKADWVVEIIKTKNYESHFVVRKKRDSNIPDNARIKLGFDIERYCYTRIDDPVFLEKRDQWKEKYTDIADDTFKEDEQEEYKNLTSSIANEILGER